MSKSMEFALRINASMNGNIQTQLQAVQNSLNAVKNSAKFASSFGNNLGAAMRYANNAADAMKIAANMKTDFGGSNLSAKLGELQKTISQIQKYKQANEQARETQSALTRSAQTAAKVKQNYNQQKAEVTRLKVELERLKTAKQNAARGEKSQYAAQIKSVQAELKTAEQNLKSVGREFQNAQSRSLNFGRNLQQQLSALSQLRAGLNQAGVNVNQLAAAERTLQTLVNSTTAALERQAQALHRRQDLSARWSNLGAQSDNFSEKYQNFQNATQTAQSIMSPFVDAARNAMDYEYSLKNVEALTQLKDIRAGNTEKVKSEMAELDKTFRNLGATTEYTSGQVAESAGYFAMAGWNADRIKAVMPAFMNLATATRTSGYELARLADVFSDDMTAAGLKAGETIKLKSGLQMESSEYFADAFAFAVTNANLNRESLHESVKYFAPVAKQLGLDVSEMFATTMLTANAGIKGSQMGTAFRSGLIRMVAPTKGAEGALAEMGLTMSDAQKQYQEAQAAMSEMGITGGTFIEKLQQMAQVFSTMSREEKVDKLNKIVGKNAISAWMEIFENPEKVAQIAEWSKYMNSAEIQGYAGDTAGVMRDSAHVQWELLKSSLDASINQIGTALLPAVIQIAQSLAPILTQFAEWISKNQELVVTLAGIAAAVSAVIVAAAGIQLISAAWGMVTASASLASGAISTAVTFLRGLSFASITAGIKGIGTAFLAAARGAMAFIATPVGAACAAIALAAYLIYQNWDKLAPLFQRVADVLKNAFGSAVEFVSGLWDGLVSKFQKLKDFFTFDFGNDNPARNAFDFSKNIPTYQSASLGNISAPQTVQAVQSVQPVQSQVATVQPTLDFSQIQMQIDNFGNSLQNQTYNFDNFGLNFQSQAANIQSQTTSLSAIINAADTSISQNAAEISAQTAAINQNANELANQTATVNQNISEFANQTATVNQNALEVANQTAAVQNSVPSIQNMAATADNSTASIANLALVSASAASAISGLGSAAQSAISSMNAAAANISAASANVATSSAGKPANNYNGGIHTGGKFLSWINEKGPEAIIPLNGSDRAVSLWQQVGEILGVYPANNYNGGIYSGKTGGNHFSISNFFEPILKILNKFAQNIKNAGENFSESTQKQISATESFSETFQNVTKLTSQSAELSKTAEIDKLKTAREKFSEEVKASKSYKSLMAAETLKTENGEYWGQQRTLNDFKISDIFNGEILGIAPAENSQGGIYGDLWKVTTPNFNPEIKTARGGGIFGRIGEIFNGEFNFDFGNVFSTVRDRIGGGINRIFDGIGNIFNSDIFNNFGDIFSNLNLSNLQSLFKDFSISGIFDNIRTRGEGLRTKDNSPYPLTLNPYSLFPNLTAPEFNPEGNFPTLEFANAGGGSFNQQSFSPSITVNVTVNASNAQEFQEAIPQITESFEEQFEKYMSEYQRRNFAW